MRSLAAHRTQKAWTATLPCWYPFKARSWFLNGHKYPMLVSDTRKGYEDTKEKIITVFYAKKGCALVFARILCSAKKGYEHTSSEAFFGFTT